jgi:hypothetical protein
MKDELDFVVASGLEDEVPVFGLLVQGESIIH